MHTIQSKVNRTVSSSRTLAGCSLLVGLLLGVTAQAEPRTLVAGNDPTLPSSFILDFGGQGGVASARIAVTHIEFEVDPDEATARFVDYYQEVEPLALPGGFSTGNMTIEIIGESSTGWYNALTGEFDIGDTYAIHFEGDLSAFGLESPVLLESSSAGIVILNPGSDGQVSMDWSGEGILADPFNPQQWLEFSYTCSVAAAFAPEPVALVQLSLVPDVLNLELPRGIERSLTAKLDVTANHLDNGREWSAVRTLNAFTNSIAAMAGKHLAAVEAEDLIGSADAISELIRTDVDSVGARLVPGKAAGRR